MKQKVSQYQYLFIWVLNNIKNDHTSPLFAPPAGNAPCSAFDSATSCGTFCASFSLSINLCFTIARSTLSSRVATQKCTCSLISLSVNRNASPPHGSADRCFRRDSSASKNAPIWSYSRDSESCSSTRTTKSVSSLLSAWLNLRQSAHCSPIDTAGGAPSSMHKFSIMLVWVYILEKQPVFTRPCSCCDPHAVDTEFESI